MRIFPQIFTKPYHKLFKGKLNQKLRIHSLNPKKISELEIKTIQKKSDDKHSLNRKT